jgi:hypothetical protein
MKITLVQLALIGLFLGSWLGALMLFRARRRRSGAAQEWAEYKARLDTWVKQIESIVQLALFLPLSLALLLSAIHFHAVFHPAESSDDVSPLAISLICFSSFAIAIAPAGLAANLISWAVPSMRRANQSAMAELPGVSFRKANIGLFKFAAITMPICAAQIAVGIILK